MLKLYLYFLQIVLKIQSCEKSVKDKSSGKNQNKQFMLFVSGYVSSLSRFLRKTAKISQYSQCRDSLPLWSKCFGN